MLLGRCKADPTTSWLAIAHVHATPEVLARLDDAQKLALFGTWTAVLHRLAELLAAVWTRSRFDLATMTVRRGNDSSTWNQLAGAWNKARDGWMGLTYALGAEAVLDAACPGKVMRLIAGDLAWMHARAGHGTEGNTAVWALLPPPWQVLRGEARCNRAMIEAACARVGLDAAATGWVAPRRPAAPVPFRPTPELVHGVVVGNPHLAAFLRRAGWYSGKGGHDGLVVTPAAAAPLPVAKVVN